MLFRQTHHQARTGHAQSVSCSNWHPAPIRAAHSRSSRQNVHQRDSAPRFGPLVPQGANDTEPAVSQQAATNTGSPHNVSNDSSQQQGRGSGASGFLQQHPSLLRKVLSSSSAADAYELILQQQPQWQHVVATTDVDLLLRCSLEAGNVDLALSMYQQLRAAKRAQAAGGSSTPASTWPAATLQHTEILVKGLTKQLRINDALAVLQGMRAQGIPGTDEVSFGHVVTSPLPPQQPLAVVQPQEGFKLVSDSNSRYEFELFSGTVTSCSSEALQVQSNPLLAAARAVGLLRNSAVAAVHELVVQAPSGGSRTFRVGTSTADVPAEQGQRITVVCSPNAGVNKQRRLLLSTSPPGTQPGEPLLISNHTIGIELLLLRPPRPGTQLGVPGWVLPAAVLLAGGDAAAGLVDPALPMLIAGGVAFAAGSALAGNSLLVPNLKKLPVNAVKLESIRQQLLGQHAKLDNKVKATLQEASDDVRTLARLWQLQAKMQSVDGGQGSAYKARIERVSAVAGGIEERLAKRLELLDGYARVMNMIEIEVEMDMQVPVAEVDGLEVELEKLSELESVKEEWQLQAEAQDEVEKLLRSPQTTLPVS